METVLAFHLRFSEKDSTCTTAVIMIMMEAARHLKWRSKFHEPVVEPLLKSSELSDLPNSHQASFHLHQTRLKAEILQNKQELKTAVLHTAWGSISVGRHPASGDYYGSQTSDSQQLATN